jgi:hypothetical protein
LVEIQANSEAANDEAVCFDLCSPSSHHKRPFRVNQANKEKAEVFMRVEKHNLGLKQRDELISSM